MNKPSILAAILVSLSTACGGSPAASAPPSIYGTWAHIVPGVVSEVYGESTATTGNGLTINHDGTYVAEFLVQTSSSTFNASVETGTFKLVDDGNATVTPQKSTCGGPDPSYNVTYSLQNGNLEIAFPTGVIVYQPDTAAPSSAAIAFGCFDGNGNFSPAALASVN